MQEVYWIPVFNVLEKTCNVCLTHSKYVKAIKGKKTDKKDANEKLNLIRRHINSIQDLQTALEKLIYELAAKCQPQIDLLMTVPGISTLLTAIRILAEIGADMSVFETAKQLTSWAGLTPQNQESAGKKKQLAPGVRERASNRSLFKSRSLSANA